MTDRKLKVRVTDGTREISRVRLVATGPDSARVEDPRGTVALTLQLLHSGGVRPGMPGPGDRLTLEGAGMTSPASVKVNYNQSAAGALSASLGSILAKSEDVDIQKMDPGTAFVLTVFIVAVAIVADRALQNGGSAELKDEKYTGISVKIIGGGADDGTPQLPDNGRDSNDDDDEDDPAPNPGDNSPPPD